MRCAVTFACPSSFKSGPGTFLPVAASNESVQFRRNRSFVESVKLSLRSLGLRTVWNVAFQEIGSPETSLHPRQSPP